EIRHPGRHANARSQAQVIRPLPTPEERVNETREDRGNDGRVENEENQTQVSLPFPRPLEIATRFPHSHRPYDFCVSKPSKPNKERRPRRRIASLPPSGSFFNEKMLSALDYIYAHAAGGAFYT